MIKLITILFLLITTPMLSIGQTTCAISSNIYFINWVNKPNELDVKKSSRRLNDSVFLYSKHTAGIKNVGYLYNYSNGIMLDVMYELATQKSMERNASITEVFVSFWMSAAGHISPISEADQLEIQTRVASAISSVLPSSTRKLVQDFSNKVAQGSLKAGTQAILVPHSQGNMFANEVYDNLRLTLPLDLFRGLGIVNVANPASRAPSGLYLTATQDLVINLLAKYQSYFGLTMPPMAPNFDASVAAYGKDLTGHGFTEVYLDPYLPYQGVFADSIVATLVKKIDSVMYQTSTFLDNPAYYFPNGVKTLKPPNYPADSTRVQVCFPGAVGGI